MKKGQVKKQYTPEERLAHVEAFKASGKSLVQYAKETGINDQTLNNWVSGRNLKTQAKKAEAKKLKNKVVAWYEKHRDAVSVTLDAVLIVLLTIDLVWGHK
jgi:transposase-like protein